MFGGLARYSSWGSPWTRGPVSRVHFPWMHFGSNAAAYIPIIACCLPSFLLVLLLLLIVSWNRGRKREREMGGQRPTADKALKRRQKSEGKKGKLSHTTTTKTAIQVLPWALPELPIYRMSAFIIYADFIHGRPPAKEDEQWGSEIRAQSRTRPRWLTDWPRWRQALITPLEQRIWPQEYHARFGGCCARLTKPVIGMRTSWLFENVKWCTRDYEKAGAWRHAGFWPSLKNHNILRGRVKFVPSS